LVTFIPEDYSPAVKMPMQIKTFAKNTMYVFDKSLANNDYEAIYLKPYIDLLTENEDYTKTYPIKEW
jgi:hypothetical protein